MAREYSRVKVNIWIDLEFRSLSTDAQHLYFLLLTHPSTNLAGIADWRPARLAALAAKWTAKQVREAGKELEDNRFIVIDEDTEEVLIRSFVRHDGILKGPKTAAGMLRELGGTSSVRIIAAVRAEIDRTVAEDPSLKGIPALSDYLSPRLPDTPSDTQSDTPSPEYPASIPIPQPSTLNPQPSTISPAPDDGFAAFWALYPRKRSKDTARRAWKAAIKKTPADVIMEALRWQLPTIAMELKPSGDFRKYPASWLNGRCWEDDAEPAHVVDKRPEGWR